MNTTTKFLSHEDIVIMKDKAATKAVCSWNTFLGDTIAEKYESLYVKVVELTNVIIRKGGSGYFWIVCGPELASVFESSTRLVYLNIDYIPQGTKDIHLIGTIERKWRLYSDPLMVSDEILIGCGSHISSEPKNFATLKVANFIEEGYSVEQLTADICNALSRNLPND